MKRIVSAVAALVILLGVVHPADAYTHFGASNNATLSRQWAKELFPSGATDAILVRSDNFADSLAAGALAGLIGAPVLMNPPGGGLNSDVAAALDELNALNVRVIGGTAAVSAQTVSDLEAAGYEVRRIAGENRVATGAAVMAEEEYDGSTFVYLARAFGDGSTAFADSLGAGMLAGTQGIPLLLTATESLSTETRDAITASPTVDTVFIVGGTAAVSPATEDQLVAMGLDVERIAGPDRFETAARVADLSFDPGRSGAIAVVDGLDANSWASGYPASAAAGGAVVLSAGDELPDATSSFLDSQATTATTDDLYCAPEVDHNACLAADAELNG